MTRIAFLFAAVLALAACESGGLYATSPGTSYDSGYGSSY